MQGVANVRRLGCTGDCAVRRAGRCTGQPEAIKHLFPSSRDRVRIRFSLHRDARVAVRGLYLHKDLRAAEIRFYLPKEFGAAEIRFYLPKEFRAAEIRFYLHKEILKKNCEKSMLHVKNFSRCAC